MIERITRIFFIIIRLHIFYYLVFTWSLINIYIRYNKILFQHYGQFQPHHPQNRHRQRHEHPMIPEGAMPPQSRPERVHNLRVQHQQRHQERHGQYPNDQREEHYEEIMRQVSTIINN